MPRKPSTRKPRPSKEKLDARFCVISSHYWIPLTDQEKRFAQNRRAQRRFFPTLEAASAHATMLMEKDKAQGFQTPELFVVEVRRIVRPKPIVQYDFFDVEG